MMTNFQIELHSFSMPGKARGAQNDFVSWMVTTDADLLLHAEQPDQAKSPLALAEVLCSLAQRQGVMNISVVDFNLKQRVAANGDAMNFRYEVTPKTKVNVFVPKQQQFADPFNIRASMFGALWAGEFAKIPQTANAKTLWEVAFLQWMFSR